VTEQIMDLRSTWAILRRGTRVLALAAALGGVAGGVAGYLLPPPFTSTSIVLLPPQPQGPSAGVHPIDTHVQIARSDAVLGPAGKEVSPRLNTAQVRERVDIQPRAADVLSITATATTAARAEALSEAVAQSELRYLESAASTLGEDARDALSARAAALAKSLAAVNTEIQKARDRLSRESTESPEGRADAAALAQLTAQQGSLALQIDGIQRQVADSTRTSGGPTSGFDLIQHASPAVRTSLVARIASFTVLGALAALIVAGLVLVLRGRQETTMRSRDQIADAIGVAVAASVQSTRPRSVAGWTTLLQDYEPDNVERWTLRQLLRLVTPGHPGSLAGFHAEGESPEVVVVTLSDDVRAVAVGPQLASFAASTGLATTLVTAQSHESANALWAACSGLAPEEHPRPGLSVDGRHIHDQADDLVVHVAVLDRKRPELRVRAAEHSVTLLAVSAGAASADDLARVALAADDARHAIARIIVVDPDPLDRTTGRLVPSERNQYAPLPSFLTGPPIAGEATALDIRRRPR
jgi:capsular polysaccharide biosynthesis protein